MRPMSAFDYPKLVAEEVHDFADLVASLDEPQLDTPSLCEGWRVRDVAGHVASGVAISVPAVVAKAVTHGFSVPKASRAVAVAWADEHSAAEMAAAIHQAAELFATGAKRKGLLRTLKPTDLVLDNLVHRQDIRRPLGMGTDLPEHQLLGALSVAPTAAGFVKANARTKGLRLEATDVDWSWGAGPVVRGPGEAILLAVTGRPAGLADLEGDGVAVLASR